MTLLPNANIFNRLANELDREAYERLAEASPGIARELADVIKGGANADQIRQFMTFYCPGAEGKSRWLQAAARYLETIKPCC